MVDDGFICGMDFGEDVRATRAVGWCLINLLVKVTFSPTPGTPASQLPLTQASQPKACIGIATI